MSSKRSSDRCGHPSTVADVCHGWGGPIEASAFRANRGNGVPRLVKMRGHGLPRLAKSEAVQNSRFKLHLPRRNTVAVGGTRELSDIPDELKNGDGGNHHQSEMNAVVDGAKYCAVAGLVERGMPERDVGVVGRKNQKPERDETEGLEDDVLRGVRGAAMRRASGRCSAMQAAGR